MKLQILVSLVALAALSGCKPKPLSGQMFISQESGTVIPAANVKVSLVRGVEAEEFIKQKKSDAEETAKAIGDKIASLKSSIDEASKKAVQLALERDAYIENKLYTNETEYISLVRESNNGLTTVNALAKQVQSLIAQYGAPPDIFTAATTPQQRAAFRSQKESVKKMEGIHARMVQIDRELESFVEKATRSKKHETVQVQNEVSALSSKLGKEEAALFDLQRALFYLKPFSPHEVEVAVTDYEGNFVFHHPEKGLKIFAKVQLDERHGWFFWLVDCPENAEKLVLSNGNTFKPPQIYNPIDLDSRVRVGL